jgi:hypothetical protein
MIIATIERLSWIKPGEKITYYRGPVTRLYDPPNYVEVMDRIKNFVHQLEINGRIRTEMYEILRPGPTCGYVEYAHIAVGL